VAAYSSSEIVAWLFDTPSSVFLGETVGGESHGLVFLELARGLVTSQW